MGIKHITIYLIATFFTIVSCKKETINYSYPKGKIGIKAYVIDNGSLSPTSHYSLLSRYYNRSANGACISSRDLFRDSVFTTEYIYIYPDTIGDIDISLKITINDTVYSNYTTITYNGGVFNLNLVLK